MFNINFLIGLIFLILIENGLTAKPRDNSESSRIAYGEKAGTSAGLGIIKHDGRYPYVVYIKMQDIMLCSGSLISADVVITAQHCIYFADLDKYVPLEMLTVKAGAYQRKSMFSKKNKVYRYVHHPHSDVALLFLLRPYTFSSKIQTIKLPMDLKRIANIRIFGFGQIETGDLTNELRYGDVMMIPDDECKVSLKYNEICLRSRTKNMYSVRQGDSGGPAVILGNSWSEDVLLGVAAAGTKRLTTDSAYTNVIPMMSWIQKELKCMGYQINEEGQVRKPRSIVN